MHKTDSDVVDRLECEGRIRAAVYLYCAAIDRARYSWMDDVFHTDAVITIGRNENSLEQLVGALRSRQAQVLRSSHMVGNILIEHVEQDRRFAESYCLTIEQVPGEQAGAGVDRVLRLRYADIFERRKGAWKIARRTLIVDHAMAPVAAATSKQFGGEKGRRDSDDPAIRMRVSLGLDC